MITEDDLLVIHAELMREVSDANRGLPSAQRVLLPIKPELLDAITALNTGLDEVITTISDKLAAQYKDQVSDRLIWTILLKLVQRRLELGVTAKQESK